MRLMSSANDLFEWIVTSSPLNDVFVIRTAILHRSFHSLLWSIRSTSILLWSCQCPKGNPQNTRRRSPRKSSSRLTIFYHDDFKDPREFALKRQSPKADATNSELPDERYGRPPVIASGASGSYRN